jgi:hypothetical protein
MASTMTFQRKIWGMDAQDRRAWTKGNEAFSTGGGSVYLVTLTANLLGGGPAATVEPAVSTRLLFPMRPCPWACVRDPLSCYSRNTRVGLVWPRA